MALGGVTKVRVAIRILGLIVGLSLFLTARTQAMAADGFKGITVIELADEQAAHVLKGHGRGGGSHIVTFVSDRGSYAALLGNHQTRECVAWAASGPKTNDSITFGLPPTEQSLKLIHPSICLPFTLSFAGPDRIRLVAENNFAEIGGALGNQAKRLRYDRAQRIIARIPLVSIDWKMAGFSRHTVNDVRVGPLPIKQTPELKLKTLNRSPVGTWKALVTVRDPHDSTKTNQAMGHVIKADGLGWPWDVLYSAETKKHPDKASLTEAFDQAVLERYGKPTTVITGRADYIKEFYWLFDLQGKQPGSLGQDPCSATFEYWKHEESLASFEKDIGPWGCSLLMVVSHNGNGVRPLVSVYSIQAVSGHVVALHHFKRRVDELDAVRKQIEKVQSFKPKL